MGLHAPCARRTQPADALLLDLGAPKRSAKRSVMRPAQRSVALLLPRQSIVVRLRRVRDSAPSPHAAPGGQHISDGARTLTWRDTPAVAKNSSSRSKAVEHTISGNARPSPYRRCATTLQRNQHVNGDTMHHSACRQPTRPADSTMCLI
jgi:hypothetical protein